MMPTGIVWMPEWQSNKEHGFRPCVSICYQDDYLLIAPCSTNAQAPGRSIPLTDSRARVSGINRACNIVMAELRWIHRSEFGRWLGKVPIGTEHKILNWIRKHKVSVPYA